jgi:DNA-binding transcriptional LysR family regulator
MHLRKIRYFVAVAERLSFAQAARDLHVAQPALTRAVKALEAELSVQLLDRDSQHVALTDAGRVLLEKGAALLAYASAARREVKAASGTHTLTVGFQPGVVITEIIRAFTEEHPDVAVRTERLECNPDPRFGLSGGGLDAALVRSATELPDLNVSHLMDDPTLVALPTSHPLAGRDCLTIGDLDGEILLRHASSDADRSSPAAVRNLEEGLEAVLLGIGLAWVPASAAAYFRRSGIVYRPVVGAPRFDIVLVIDPAQLDRDAVKRFRRCAREYYSTRAHELSLASDSIPA